MFYKNVQFFMKNPGNIKRNANRNVTHLPWNKKTTLHMKDSGNRDLKMRKKDNEDVLYVILTQDHNFTY